MIALALAIVFSLWGRLTPHWFAVAIECALMPLLIFTGSRSAMLATAVAWVACAARAVFSRRSGNIARSLHVPLASLICGVLLCVASVGLRPSVVTALARGDGGRMELWSACIGLVNQRVFRGWEDVPFDFALQLWGIGCRDWQPEIGYFTPGNSFLDLAFHWGLLPSMALLSGVLASIIVTACMADQCAKSNALVASSIVTVTCLSFWSFRNSFTATIVCTLIVITAIIRPLVTPTVRKIYLKVAACFNVLFLGGWYLASLHAPTSTMVCLADSITLGTTGGEQAIVVCSPTIVSDRRKTLQATRALVDSGRSVSVRTTLPFEVSPVKLLVLIGESCQVPNKPYFAQKVVMYLPATHANALPPSSVLSNVRAVVTPGASDAFFSTTHFWEAIAAANAIPVISAHEWKASL